MTLEKLKTTQLYRIMMATGYTDEAAMRFAQDLEKVLVDGCERFRPAPEVVDVPDGRGRK